MLNFYEVRNVQNCREGICYECDKNTLVCDFTKSEWAATNAADGDRETEEGLSDPNLSSHTVVSEQPAVRLVSVLSGVQKVVLCKECLCKKVSRQFEEQFDYSVTLMQEVEREAETTEVKLEQEMDQEIEMEITAEIEQERPKADD